MNRKTVEALCTEVTAAFEGMAKVPYTKTLIVYTDSGEPALAIDPRSLGPELINVLPLDALDRLQTWAPRIDGTMRKVNYGELARALVGLWSFLGHGVPA